VSDTAAKDVAWIAVDWGTTNLRLWVMDANDRVLASAGSDRGMATLSQSGFEDALLELVDPWLIVGLVTPVICCGMVGSRQGWAEARYLTVPCPPPGGTEATRVKGKDTRMDVRILPGLKQLQPADVMRGEETQIAGYLANRPAHDGVVCLPGTHTKWVDLHGGNIARFQTFMTGEMYALLSQHSVLRHSVGGETWDAQAFAAGVAQSLQAPDALAGSLFGIRAAGLISGLSPDAARARLSGLLIGAEMSAARPFWSTGVITIIGADLLSRLYTVALQSAGVTTSSADVADMTLQGLIAARHTLID
jgi:2-dehydro-3-deoxygalactonokinase